MSIRNFDTPDDAKSSVATNSNVTGCERQNGVRWEPDRWYMTREVGLSPETLADWAKTGRGPAYSQPGGLRTPRYYLGADLIAFFEAHKVSSTAEAATRRAGR